MSKCKGTPVYTQHSVAWPELELRDRILEEVSVSFDDKGGGTYGEFTFRWYHLGYKSSLWGGTSTEPRYPHGALRIDCFTDGLPALLDDRIQAVLGNLRRHNRSPKPAKLIQLLEDNGVVASNYHLEGARNG